MLRQLSGSWDREVPLHPVAAPLASCTAPLTRLLEGGARRAALRFQGCRHF